MKDITSLSDFRYIKYSEDVLEHTAEILAELSKAKSSIELDFLVKTLYAYIGSKYEYLGLIASDKSYDLYTRRCGSRYFAHSYSSDPRPLELRKTSEELLQLLVNSPSQGVREGLLLGMFDVGNIRGVSFFEDDSDPGVKVLASTLIDQMVKAERKPKHEETSTS